MNAPPLIFTCKLSVHISCNYVLYPATIHYDLFFFLGVNLKGSDLEGSQLGNVNLRVATLKGANLQNCNLRGAELAGADLEVRFTVAFSILCKDWETSA